MISIWRRTVSILGTMLPLNFTVVIIDYPLMDELSAESITYFIYEVQVRL